MADLHPSEAPINGGPPPETLAPGAGSKRQRRPSVRLGDIGEQPAAIPHESYVRRSKQWVRISSHPPPHHHNHHSPKESMAAMGKISSKTRPLTNLASEDCYEPMEIPVIEEGKSLHLGDENLESIAGIRRGSRDGKLKRGGGPVVKRVRSNWVSKVDEGLEVTDLKSSGGEDTGEEGYRDYDDLRREDSESPLKEHSLSDRRAARGQVSESRDAGPASATDAAEVDVPSETEGRDWNNGQCQLVEDGGVRSWLNGLGLGRYAPVFEIHEVDDEVLPLLTLEDLKDMGINAVGSRRKLYCAIQKFGKSFT